MQSGKAGGAKMSFGYIRVSIQAVRRLPSTFPAMHPMNRSWVPAWMQLESWQQTLRACAVAETPVLSFCAGGHSGLENVPSFPEHVPMGGIMEPVLPHFLLGM